MSTKDRVKEYGQAVGVDCVLLRTYGATEQQIKSYTMFKGGQVPAEYKLVYWAGIHQGTSFVTGESPQCDKLTHPIYEAYRQTIRRMITENWYCLRAA